MKISRNITILKLSLLLILLFLLSCDSPFGPYDEGEGQAPFELTAVFLGSAIELNWGTTPGSEESAYIVYRSTGDPYHYKEIARITGWATDYRDTGIELDKYYYYKVKTEYDGKPGKDSNQVSEYTAPYLLWFTTFYDSPPKGNVYAYNPGTGTIHEVSDIWNFDDYGIDTPYGISSDDRYIYLSDIDIRDDYSTYLNKIDRTTGEIVATVGPRDYYYRLTFDGTNLWTCIDGNLLLTIDPDSGDIVDQMTIKRFYYHGLTWVNGYIYGLRIYIGDSDIYQIDIDDNSVVNTLKVDLDYPGLTWDGEYIWGTHRKTYSSNTVFDLCRVDITSGDIVNFVTIEIDGPGTIIDIEAVQSRIIGS